MSTFLLFLATLNLLLLILAGLDLVRGHRTIRFLKHLATFDSHVTAPLVSVIIPARNEERNLEEALQSVLHQDYPNLEFIVLNDRSTDRTGEILTRLAQQNSRLQVFHIQQLPEGWLGKNHALYYGSQHAKGEFLLFTDADIVMQPSTLGTAVNYMISQSLDHLTILPDMNMRGFVLEMFAATFGVFFLSFYKPWKANDPKSDKFIGIGAFNLVKTSVYHAMGTHQTIAMRPDDDVKLGKLVKRHGYRQEMLFGQDLVQVEWYASVPELIHGLTKNMFAGMDYSLIKVIQSTMQLLVFNLWPFLAIWLTAGMTQMMNFLIVSITILLCWDLAHFSKVNRWFGLVSPFTTLLFLFILWKSTLTTLITGGIEWRGTRYSLKELRRHQF